MDLMELVDVIEIVMLEFPAEVERMIGLYNDEKFEILTCELRKLFKVREWDEK